MLSNTYNSIRNLYISRNLCLTIANVHIPRIQFFSAKHPNQPENPENPQKRPKKQPVPKITLITSDNNVNVTTLEEAQQLSKRRDLKLVRVIDLDTKTQRPIYKLMTGTEYHAEELKQRELKKKERQSNNALKGEKLLILNASISKHDLETNIRKISKWITKKYEVRVVVSGNTSNSVTVESLYKFLEESLKEQTRFVQKRVKGDDLRFQIIPTKSKESEDKPL